MNAPLAATLLDRTRHTGTRLLRARLAAVVAALALLAWMGGRSPGLLAFAAPRGLPAVLTRIPDLAAAALAQAQIITIQRPAAGVSPAKPRPLRSGRKISAPSRGQDYERLHRRTGREGYDLHPESRRGRAAKLPKKVPSPTTRASTKSQGRGPGQYRVFVRIPVSWFPLTGRRPRKPCLCRRTESRRHRSHADAARRHRGPGGEPRTGEPMANYYVTPLVFQYVGGRKVMVQAQGSPMSNDAGEYRLTGLPPGRYYIQVAAARTGGDAEQDRSAKPRQEDYVTSYYPGIADPSAAVPVAVAPGRPSTASTYRWSNRTSRASAGAW